MFNISYRKVGGLRFLKIGRLTFMFSVSKVYKPIKGTGQIRVSGMYPSVGAYYLRNEGSL